MAQTVLAGLGGRGGCARGPLGQTAPGTPARQEEVAAAPTLERQGPRSRPAPRSRLHVTSTCDSMSSSLIGRSWKPARWTAGVDLVTHASHRDVVPDSSPPGPRRR